LVEKAVSPGCLSDIRVGARIAAILVRIQSREARIARLKRQAGWFLRRGYGWRDWQRFRIASRLYDQVLLGRWSETLKAWLGNRERLLLAETKRNRDPLDAWRRLIRILLSVTRSDEITERFAIM